MEIYIDNVKTTLNSIAFETLDEIIKAAEKYAIEKNRIVSEAFIDGKPLDEIGDIIMEEIGTIEFTTKTPKVIFLDALQEMNQYLDRLRNGLQKICEHLEQDNEREAMNMIAEAVNGLEWIYNIFSAGENISNIDYQEIGFKDVFERYKNILGELVKSIENRDNIMLSDLFGYEVIPLIDEIQDFIPKIYNHIMDEEQNEQPKN